MSQRKGIYRILDIPILYNFVQKLFDHKRTRLRWHQLIKGYQNGIILDIGCGPGNQSIHFKNSKLYIGLDISQIYINEARQLYGSFGKFYTMSATEIDKLPYSDIDLVILNGVFHHLSDEQVKEVLEKVAKKLGKNGVLVTVDPTLVKGRIIANSIVSKDRGMHVREPSSLLAITEKYLKTINCDVIEQKFPPYQRIILKLGSMV